MSAEYIEMNILEIFIGKPIDMLGSRIKNYIHVHLSRSDIYNQTQRIRFNEFVKGR